MLSSSTMRQGIMLNTRVIYYPAGEVSLLGFQAQAWRDSGFTLSLVSLYVYLVGKPMNAGGLGVYSRYWIAALHGSIRPLMAS